MMMPTLRIEQSQHGERLDVTLARAYPTYSRSFLQKVMKQGGVTLKGLARSTNYRVKAGEIFDIIDFQVKPTRNPVVASAQRPFVIPGGSPIPDIVFEDDELLVIDKPAGWVVHPATGHRSGDTLVDWARDHLGVLANRFDDPDRLGLVHRLDKETSGVLLLAKNVQAQEAVSRQFRERLVKKTYSAFVEGVPSAVKGVIAAPLGRSRKEPRRMAITGNGRPSETLFEVNEALKEVSQVTLFPKTGRTHQIRVHVAAIGHPVVGDKAYGARIMANERFGITRTLLHAQQLDIFHPGTQKPISFKAPWPADFKRAQKLFREAFLVIAVACGMGHVKAYAEDSDTTPPVHHTHHSAASSSTAPSLSSQVRLLKKDLAAQKESVDALTVQVAALQTSMSQLDAQSRLQNLEKAVSELNGKAVSISMTSEEAKTQGVDSTRKLKSFQDMLDDLRDKVERLRTQADQWNAKDKDAPSPAVNLGVKNL